MDWSGTGCFNSFQANSWWNIKRQSHDEGTYLSTCFTLFIGVSVVQCLVFCIVICGPLFVSCVLGHCMFSASHHLFIYLQTTFWGWTWRQPSYILFCLMNAYNWVNINSTWPSILIFLVHLFSLFDSSHPNLIILMCFVLCIYFKNNRMAWNGELIDLVPSVNTIIKLYIARRSLKKDYT